MSQTDVMYPYLFIKKFFSVYSSNAASQYESYKITTI